MIFLENKAFLNGFVLGAYDGGFGKANHGIHV